METSYLNNPGYWRIGICKNKQWNNKSSNTRYEYSPPVEFMKGFLSQKHIEKNT